MSKRNSQGPAVFVIWQVFHTTPKHMTNGGREAVRERQGLKRKKSNRQRGKVREKVANSR